MSLYTLVFMSRARRPVSEEELHDIVRVSLENNGPSAVTSILLYAQQHFLEILEGPRDEIDWTFGRICRDPRHTRIEVLLSAPIVERSFGDDAMQVLNLGESTEIDHDELRAIADQAKDDPGKAAIAAFDIIERFYNRYSVSQSKYAA